jgi:hypothetical protein
VPDRNDKRGAWITLGSNLWRGYGDAFDDAIPQRRVVIADQYRMYGASNAPAKIARAENYEWDRNSH